MEGIPAAVVLTAVVLVAEELQIPIDSERVAAAGPADPVGAGRAGFPLAAVDILEGNHYTAAKGSLAVAARTVLGPGEHRSVPLKSSHVVDQLFRHHFLQKPNLDWISLVPKYLRKPRTRNRCKRQRKQ